MGVNDYKIILDGERYFHRLNQRFFHLPILVYIVPNGLNKKWLALYRSTWRIHGAKARYGAIHINAARCKFCNTQEMFMIIRHELAHAICDIRYGLPLNHGKEWRRIAKLLRVNILPYEKEIV